MSLPLGISRARGVAALAALWLGSTACGGALTSPSDGAPDGGGPADARESFDASGDEVVVDQDAGLDAAQVATCESCLHTRCTASYATCAASAVCMAQLEDVVACRAASQNALPPELVLCLGNCDACDNCHPPEPVDASAAVARCDACVAQSCPNYPECQADPKCLQALADYVTCTHFNQVSDCLQELENNTHVPGEITLCIPGSCTTQCSGR